MESTHFDPSKLSGRNRRLLSEWHQLETRLDGRTDLSWRVLERNGEQLPTAYLVDYHLRSICGVENMEQLNEPGVENAPVFATGFLMRISLPANYPCVDGAPQFTFLTHDQSGQPIAHPWHPNIRFFGDFAGRVCINMPDTYTDLAWAVLRIGSYLRYETYHAVQEPPFPEDLKVAAWVVRQGEPRQWIFFNQDETDKCF
jgi:hypothetical protein